MALPHSGISTISPQVAVIKDHWSKDQWFFSKLILSSMMLQMISKTHNPRCGLKFLILQISITHKSILLSAHAKNFRLSFVMADFNLFSP
jgi:hypothetical protein